MMIDALIHPSRRIRVGGVGVGAVEVSHNTLVWTPIGKSHLVQRANTDAMPGTGRSVEPTVDDRIRGIHT
jgi:hypothetical protein